jgi:hypothetical protein
MDSAIAEEAACLAGIIAFFFEAPGNPPSTMVKAPAAAAAAEGSLGPLLGEWRGLVCISEILTTTKRWKTLQKCISRRLMAFLPLTTIDGMS